MTILLLIVAGRIRPCFVTFGADQSDESDLKQSAKEQKYFHRYYFSVGTSTPMAVTLIFYIQDDIGWAWGLGIPTQQCFSLSVNAFVGGYPLYRNLGPAGSPFTRWLQVCVAGCIQEEEAMVLYYLSFSCLQSSDICFSCDKISQTTTHDRTKLEWIESWHIYTYLTFSIPFPYSENRQIWITLLGTPQSHHLF